MEQMKGFRPWNISTDAVDIWMELLGEDEQVREVERRHESHHEPRSRADNNEVVFDHVIDDVRIRLACFVSAQSSNGGPQLPEKLETGNLDQDEGISPDNWLSATLSDLNRRSSSKSLGI